MRRGDVVILSMAGDFGKPRPAIIVQSDAYDLESLIVCPATTDLQPLGSRIRINVAPTPANGFERRSQLMVDKLSAVAKSRIGKVVGRAEAEVMETLSAAIATLLELR